MGNDRSTENLTHQLNLFLPLVTKSPSRWTTILILCYKERKWENTSLKCRKVQYKELKWLDERPFYFKSSVVTCIEH